MFAHPIETKPELKQKKLPTVVPRWQLERTYNGKHYNDSYFDSPYFGVN